jgi:glycine oxidase
VSRPDVAIVGGGLVGRCLAWRASLSGARVVLYDSASSRGINSAAWAAAGMIAPTTEAIDTDVQIASMGNHSLKLWFEELFVVAFEELFVVGCRGASAGRHVRS